MNQMDSLMGNLMQIEHLYIQFAKQKGLHNPNILYIYFSLTRHEHRSQQEVCAEFAISKQTLSPLFQNLQQQNIIEIVPNSRDKREKRWQLTITGRQIAEPVIREMREWERTAFAQLGDAQSAMLLQLSAKLAAALAQTMKAA